jgi:hypothetical protein
MTAEHHLQDGYTASIFIVSHGIKPDEAALALAISACGKAGEVTSIG